MNRQQAGVLAIATLTVVTLSLSATALASLEGKSTDATAGTAIFTEDATLDDDLNPQEQNLSGSPFLEMLYELTPGVSEETNTTNVSSETGGGTSILPFAVLFGGLLATGSILFGVWLWRIRSASTAGHTISDDVVGARGGDEETETDVLDRLDLDAFDNEVYRAWYRMVRQLDVRGRRSVTPRELADFAVDQGMDQDAVETLTRQFEFVRYSDVAATAEHERRAREALSRLGSDEEAEQ
jgi:hypothetical protein